MKWKYYKWQIIPEKIFQCELKIEKIKVYGKD